MVSVPPVRASGYRGRVAPSPTGYLHVGHARTFFRAYERARDGGGTLVMRMEDLDRERSREEYAEAAYEDLHWLGIRWQEGPKEGGPCAPYEQSKRLPLYLEAWRRLLRGGFLFACSCSRKDLAAAAGAPHEDGDPLDDEPVYPGTCRSGTCRGRLGAPSQSGGATAGELESPGSVNWRFRVPDGEAVEFVDENLGPQSFVAGRDFGDFLVWRRDGTPSYQLACVADDALMGITEVVRGADLLKSTARQLLLYRALGIEAPRWFHCRLVTDEHGRRLAKRHDALSIRTLRQRGMMPLEIVGAGLGTKGLGARG